MMSQRHEDYYGFVKIGFEKQKKRGASAIRFVQHFGATWSIFGASFDPIGFLRGSQNRPFLNKSNTNKKNEVQETALKKHDLFIDVLMLK